jgi:hypothetical protein
MTPKIKVYFIVTGRFDPDEFTKAIGLKPKIVWRAGETVQNTLIKRKSDGWKITIDETASYDLDVEVKKLISVLDPYNVGIAHYCKENDLNAEFSCVVTTKEDEYPSIHFDKKLLKKIKSFNAEIDIDIC